MKMQKANCFCCLHDAILNPRGSRANKGPSLGLSACSGPICMDPDCCLLLSPMRHPDLEGPLSEHQTSTSPQTCSHLRDTPRFTSSPSVPTTHQRLYPLLPGPSLCPLPCLPASPASPVPSLPSTLSKGLLKSDQTARRPSSPN